MAGLKNGCMRSEGERGPCFKMHGWQGESSLGFSILFPLSKEMHAAPLVMYYCLQMFGTHSGNTLYDLRCHKSVTQIFSYIMVELTLIKIVFIL